MPRTRSTLYRPVLGSAYYVTNTKTKEKLVCYVLKPTDAKQYGQIRSGRSCKRGEEFFKVFINDDVYRMNNSLQNGICLSDDKIWEFTNEKATCDRRPRIKSLDTIKKTTGKQAKPNRGADVEYVSDRALSKIIK
jgi:hypothetical protein